MLVWALVTVVLLPGAGRVGDVLEVDASVAGSESAAVQRLLAGPLASPYARFAVLVVAGAPSPTDSLGAAMLRRLAATVAAAPEVSGTFSYLDGADTLFIAPDGIGTFLIVGLAESDTRPDRVVARLRSLTAGLLPELRIAHPALSLHWTGEAALNVDLRRTSARDVLQAERRALPVTALFLLFAFGALAAALLPVVSGTLAITISLGLAAEIARVWPLTLLLQSVVSMLGLGLGIDYALLTVSRFREAGVGNHDRATALRHAGHTILLSAATVSLGFVALLTVPLNEIRAIAVGGLLVVVISALLATTLLPGVLMWIGPRIDWGRVRPQRSQASADRWRRLGWWVTGHPWTALLLGSAPLLLLAAQSARIRTGLPNGEWLPSTMESARGLSDLDAMGRGGIVHGLRIVVEFPEGTTVRRSTGWQALSRYVAPLEIDPRVARVRSVIGVARAAGMGRSALTFLPDSQMAGLLSEDGRQALVELLPQEWVTPDSLMQFARELRRSGATASGITGAVVLVGGLPAFNADYQDAVTGRFRQIVALVVIGTVLALVAGFRSLLVPLKAVVLNLLSVAASFGALTLVFQEGHGGGLLGIPEPLGAVFASLPLIVFAIVFGLSMDYEVFLMARVREERLAGRGDREAIIEALGSTGQVITNAAAVMLIVFSAFTLGDFLMLKMLGFSLAVAVLVDATLVRTVIGPALLQLAGRWNWWPGSGAVVPTAPTEPRS